ncbi:hypothetical protein M8J76_012587 [Diaphorina citri]|nr:hypothetical protein M8J76_012587 [Diaphorina citri]
MAMAWPISIVLVAECLLLSCLVLSVHSAVDLKKYFTCHRSDPEFNKCATKAFNDLQPILAPGIPELGFEPFDPMFIPRIEVDSFAGMTLKEVLTNVNITGLKDAKLTKADFTKLPNSIDMTWDIPFMKIKDDYTLDGVIIGMPFKGKGQGFLNCTKIRNVVKITTELVKKDGQDYLHVKDFKYFLGTPKAAHLKFTNSLSKDNTLTEAMMKFFNDNWKVLFDTFKDFRNSGVNEAVKKGANTILSMYPYEQMFPK